MHYSFKIGLAVDDIKGVQDKAALKRLAMQVTCYLSQERCNCKNIFAEKGLE